MADNRKLNLESLQAPPNEEHAISKEKVLITVAGENSGKTEKELTNEDMDEALRALDSLIDMAKKDKALLPTLGKLSIPILALGAPGVEIIHAYKEGRLTGKFLIETLKQMWANYKTVKEIVPISTAEAEIKRLIQKAEELDK